MHSCTRTALIADHAPCMTQCRIRGRRENSWLGLPSRIRSRRAAWRGTRGTSITGESNASHALSRQHKAVQCVTRVAPWQQIPAHTTDDLRKHNSNPPSGILSNSSLCVSSKSVDLHRSSIELAEATGKVKMQSSACMALACTIMEQRVLVAKQRGGSGGGDRSACIQEASRYCEQSLEAARSAKVLDRLRTEYGWLLTTQALMLRAVLRFHSGDEAEALDLAHQFLSAVCEETTAVCAACGQVSLGEPATRLYGQESRNMFAAAA